MPTAEVRGAILKTSVFEPRVVSWVKVLSEIGSDAFEGCISCPETRAIQRTRPDKKDAMVLATVDVGMVDR